jgi:hypothetical protein
MSKKRKRIRPKPTDFVKLFRNVIQHSGIIKDNEKKLLKAALLVVASQPSSMLKMEQDVEVKKAEDGSRGVFAKHTLRRCRYLEYWGIRTPTDDTKHQGNHTVKAGKYDINAEINDGKVAGSTRMVTLAGLINEPPPGKRANCALAHLSGTNRAIVFVASEWIFAGEELLVHYGDDFNRDYEVGKEITSTSFLKSKEAEAITQSLISGRKADPNIAAMTEDLEEEMVFEGDVVIVD